MCSEVNIYVDVSEKYYGIWTMAWCHFSLPYIVNADIQIISLTHKTYIYIYTHIYILNQPVPSMLGNALEFPLRSPHYWPFVRGIHRSPVNSPHRGQWRGALVFSLICAWTNGWVNSRDAGDTSMCTERVTSVCIVWYRQCYSSQGCQLHLFSFDQSITRHRTVLPWSIVN